MRVSRLLAEISPWEAVAVALAIIYLLLAIRQNIWCWAAAIASTAIYVGLMFSASLYMESGLQIFYIAVAVYGWWEWHLRGPEGKTLPVTTWPWRRHGVTVAGILVMSVASGFFLHRFTPAAMPYLDSFTTWGAIITTYMVARKLLENWVYWFVIDSVSVYVYLNRGLFLTAALFMLYLVMIIFGYRAWRESMMAKAA